MRMRKRIKQVVLNVDSNYVWEEVVKMTAYVGHKLTEQVDADPTAYDRILMTDDDAKSFQLFWIEAATAANDQLKEIILMPSQLDGDYTILVSASDSYDEMFNPSVESALTSYFINAILGRWFMLVYKDIAESYFVDAVSMMAMAFRYIGKRRPIHRRQSMF